MAVANSRRPTGKISIAAEIRLQPVSRHYSTALVVLDAVNLRVGTAAHSTYPRRTPRTCCKLGKCFVSNGQRFRIEYGYRSFELPRATQHIFRCCRPTQANSGKVSAIGSGARQRDHAGLTPVLPSVLELKPMMLWARVMDHEFYRQQAQRVRDLADMADPFTRKRLLDLADQCDAKINKPSRASRMIERPLPLPRASGSQASGEA